MCVHSGMWFCSSPAICGFSFKVFFPDSLSYCYEKLTGVVFSARARSCDLLWNMAVVSVWQNHKEWIWLCDLIAVFEETLASWSGKPCPSASCANISTCLKNVRETTWPLGSSWRPLVWRQGGPPHHFSIGLCKEYTQGPPSDATPLKWGQLAVEERCISVLHLYFNASKISIMQFSAACFAKRGRAADVP